MSILNQPLPHQDAHRVRAAEGWLELGDLGEATKELDSVTSVLRAHPDVLAVRYKIYAQMKDWPMCEQIARALTKVAPEHPSGWVSLCQCLHFQGKTQEAYNTLSTVMPQFPNLAIMEYDLACYACRLGRVDEARVRLDKALEHSDQAEDMKRHAKEDPDLKELW